MNKILTIIIFFITLNLFGEQDALFKNLELRVKQLEKQINILLEKEIEDDAAKNERSKALYRILRDGEVYSREELREAERIFRFISNSSTDVSVEKELSILREKYPAANQTGCALITWALNQKEESKITALNEVITNHSDCYFSDGVNVGAFARLYLALHLRSINEIDNSLLLINEIKSSYPYAIDHKGIRLIEHLEELEAILPLP
ncbi:MAG: hypothetical protein ACJ0BW_00195 [Pontiellaceae bacterium]